MASNKYLNLTGLQTLWTKIKAVFAPKENGVYYVLGTSGYANWSANTAYAVGANVVNPSGECWTCNTAHTSGSSWSSTNWNRISAVALTGTIDGVTALYAGLKIAYRFQVLGGEGSTTLNVNNLGAKTITRGTGAFYRWTIGRNGVAILVYDGSAWRFGDYDSNDLYALTDAYCSTAAGTNAKAATSSGFNYSRHNNIPFRIYFTNANTYNGNLTLNVNSQGAKPLWINGSASSSSNKTIAVGVYWCYYDGTQFQLWTDKSIWNYKYRGDGSSLTETFTAASSRANIASGESNATIFGKIARWFSDLKALAFKDKVGTGDVESGTYGISVSGNAGTASAAQSGSALETAINGKSPTSHTHKVKINGTEKTIAATSGAAVDLGTYLTAHQDISGKMNTSGSNAVAPSGNGGNGATATLLNNLTGPNDLDDITSDDVLIPTTESTGVDQSIWYKRPLSKLWPWIKSKLTGSDVNIGGFARHAWPYGRIRLWTSSAFDSSKPYYLLASSRSGTGVNWRITGYFRLEFDTGEFCEFSVIVGGGTSTALTQKEVYTYRRSTAKSAIDSLLHVSYTNITNKICTVNIYAKPSMTYKAYTLRKMDFQDRYQGGHDSESGIDDYQWTFYKNPSGVASVDGTEISLDHKYGAIRENEILQTISNPNWNNLTTTGIYEITNSAAAGTNGSPESNNVTLVVINTNGYVTQTAYGGKIYYRTRSSSGTWDSYWRVIGGSQSNGASDLSMGSGSSNTLGRKLSHKVEVVLTDGGEAQSGWKLCVSDSVGSDDQTIYFT